MIRYLTALAWYHLVYFWLVITGRKRKDSPEYFLRAYNAQAHAWNRMQWRKR